MPNSYKIENSYKTPDYDRFFRYFIELFRIALTQGKASDAFLWQQEQFPPLELDQNNAVRRYVLDGLSLVQDALLPTVLSMLLENLLMEYAQEATLQQRKMMNVARTLMQAMVTEDVDVLAFLWPLWNTDLRDFLQTDFYPSLPPDLRKRYL